MRLRHLALPSVAGLALLAIPFSPAVAAEAECDPTVTTCTAVFDFTGGAQAFTVPAGVTNLIVALGGASGGDGLDEGDLTAAGGNGGAVEAIVPVTPGETLTLVVGGKGGDAVVVPVDPADPNPPVPPAAAGGYGGGGIGTSAIDGPVGGGGGGSFLFGANGVLLAVGGGGGAGFSGQNDTATGGDGGATDAAAGAPTGFGGVGANAAGPGAAGGGESGVAGSGPATGADAFGTGGAAAGTCSAGGGGGGYFGGGSGGCDVTQDQTAKKSAKAKNVGVAANAVAADITPIYGSGGGGGGSGFVGAGTSLIADSAGALDSEDGNGVIALGYTSAATTTTLTTTATTLAPGQEATLDATVDGPALTIGAPTDAESPAGRTAAAAFGAATAKTLAAAAVPTQPAAPGSTITPGTACGTTPCTVTIFVNGVALGDPITVDPTTGVASVTFTAGSDPGVRSIVARYDGNLYYLQSSSAPVSIDVAGLANTGVENIAPMLLASTGLLVAGAGLVVFGRRRPQLGAHRAA